MTSLHKEHISSMSRAQFQVLILPFRVVHDGEPEYAVTKRADMDAWQFLSGGGEDDETPLEAAIREAMEEGGIPDDYRFIELDSVASIPASCFTAREEWGDDVYVVPEYTFGVDMKNRDLTLSSEHSELQWLRYEEASKTLTWDSNRTALWELNERITKR